ncbi:zinc finger protein 782-like [Maniola hyperantus]|uniref:zinc finger protein 782-like n=1 Tax=Aphantopus hyperantus TaxID=2795564 RepID=UPI00213E4175
MEQQATASICDADSLIEPKEEMLGDPESILDDVQDFIIPKEELSNTSPHSDTSDSDQHIFSMLKPIKIETVLSKGIAELQKVLKSSEDTKTTFCDTEVNTLDMRIQVKREPFQAEARENSQPVNDKQTVTSSNNHTPQDRGKNAYCSKTTKMNLDLLPENRFECNHCQYTTNYKVHLIKHLCTRHTSTKPYSCKVCNYKCTQKYSLELHMRTHTGERTHHCKQCDYKCSRSSVLKNHIRTHTGEKPYNCKHCDYTCSQPSNLKSHIRTHTGEKPYNCKHCDYKCLRSSDLKKHIITHTGDKSYNCKYCDYKCSRLSDLKSHIRTHTGEKPYNCKHCDYKCSQPSNLKSHIRTHTGEKPYNCKHCDYKCSWSSNLKSHTRIHTGEKPH